jgi:hypothetical protein
VKTASLGQEVLSKSVTTDIRGIAPVSGLVGRSFDRFTVLRNIGPIHDKG